MKTTKIRGIEKTQCTAEQKIAYNLAFRYADLGAKIEHANVPEFVKSDALYEIERLVLKDIKDNEKLSQYNHDAILIAFRQGFPDYCRHPFIATNYSAIGECFKIPYNIE